MRSVRNLNSGELTQRLTYAGFVLVGFELVKSMIVGPIKAFYADTTFGQGMPFKSYEDDVRNRATNEFEACLLYLRDLLDAVEKLSTSRTGTATSTARDIAPPRAGSPS